METRCLESAAIHGHAQSARNEQPKTGDTRYSKELELLIPPVVLPLRISPATACVVSPCASADKAIARAGHPMIPTSLENSTCHDLAAAASSGAVPVSRNCWGIACFMGPRKQASRAASSKSNAVDRRQVVGYAIPRVSLIVRRPERPGGASEGQAVPRFVDVETVPKGQIVSMFLRQAPA